MRRRTTRTRTAIRRSTRTLRNRLHSIAADARFVSAVADAYALPVVANARAGDWYVDPASRAGGAYFKSTDGHTNEWGFSLRRLNLGLLPLAGAAGGAVLVDSTRRGKRFPDSLAKTVPIWAAVLNAALFPELFPAPALHTTPLAVAPHEAAAIARRLPGFLAEFLALGLDLGALRAQVGRPLRPLFVTPASPLPAAPPRFDAFVPLVLVTASQVTAGSGTEGEYIQGAGDDHEGWAAESGLDPAVFWKHHEAILAASEADLADVVARAVADGAGSGASAGAGLTRIAPTKNIFVASAAEARAAAACGEFVTGVAVNCSETGDLDLARPADAAVDAAKTIINCRIPAGKRGNKLLRMIVPDLVDDLRDEAAKGRSIVFVCDSGDDVAPAVALVVLCLFFDETGKFIPGGQERREIDKTYIKRRLAWISAARPSANPARGLLNAVNSILMGRED